MQKFGIGQPVTRFEDARLLRGEGRYLGDVDLPRQAYAVVLRSPHAHARIRDIDTAAATAAPGVLAVYTGRDYASDGLGGPKAGMPRKKADGSPMFAPQRPALCVDRVRYVGEPIAAVIAASAAEAEDLVESTFFDIEEAEPVVDVYAALQPDAPRVHDWTKHNVLVEGRIRTPGFDDVFKSAAHVVEIDITSRRQNAMPLEARGAHASFDARTGRITLTCSTQSPHVMRTAIAELLGMAEADLRVVAPDVGGGFGPKANLYPEEYAVAMAAVKLGQPVKWVEDRKEHFVTTTQQRDTIWEMEVASTAEGRILAMRGRCLHDVGAYIPYGLIVSGTALSSFPGPYALEALDLTLDAVYTNMVPVTPIRGAGRPDACFVMERLADKVAHELKLGRDIVRRRSFVTKAQMPYTTGLKGRDGTTPIAYDSGNYAGCLDLVLSKARDFRQRQAVARAQGRYLGLGLSSCVEDTGVGPYEGTTIRIDVNGKVIVSSGAAVQGQGTRTILAQITADALGVAIADITVELQDTDKFPLGMGAVGSRTAVMAGSSTHIAAQLLREKVLATAAGVLESGNRFLELADGEVRVVGAPETKVTLAALAQRHAGAFGAAMAPGVTPDLSATAYAEFKGLAFANGSNIAEVEVDIETGEVKVSRYAVAHDCGRMINPRLVEHRRSVNADNEARSCAGRTDYRAYDRTTSSKVGGGQPLHHRVAVCAPDLHQCAQFFIEQQGCSITLQGDLRDLRGTIADLTVRILPAVLRQPRDNLLSIGRIHTQQKFPGPR